LRFVPSGRKLVSSRPRLKQYPKKVPGWSQHWQGLELSGYTRFSKRFSQESWLEA
jgi:hypothetical protein